MSNHDYTDRPLIYVAGYYSANPAHGIANAAKAWAALLELGALPVVPHSTFLLDLAHPMPPEFWYAYDLGILEHCDAMYVCEDETTWRSTGVQDEISFCEQRGIPIFYEAHTLQRWLSGFTEKPWSRPGDEVGCDCG